LRQKTNEDFEIDVLEHNGDLIEEKRTEICVKIDDFKSYFYETKSSQSLIVNLVEERPGFKYGN
jgi:hypothetical protein